MTSLLGGPGGGGTPFDRTFFNVSLDALLEGGGHSQPPRLTLFLADGVTMDVCKIEEATDSYLVLRGYHDSDEACELSLNVIPYVMITRLELQARVGGGTRLGFTPSKAR